MIILWDEPKRLSNIVKQGFDFTILDEPFFRTVTYFRVRGNRVMAINIFRGRIVTVIAKPHGSEAISIISMRAASRRELRQL